MILAAGRGQRLRPLTDSCPKALIPIAGKPLLEYVIRLLVRYGFDEIVINLHHLPNEIETFCGTGSYWGARITYSKEEELLGTAGAVGKVRSCFDEPFMVYYGDNLCNVDLEQLWTDHLRSGKLATVGLLPMDDPTTRGIIQLDEDGTITRLIEKPAAAEVFDDYLVNAGIYALEPEVLAAIPENTFFDFSHDLFPAMLGKGQAIHGHRLRGQLLSTDTLARYRHAQEQVDAGAFDLP
jgi:NDP-sugar pyrophosphorylase family protein